MHNSDNRTWNERLGEAIEILKAKMKKEGKKFNHTLIANDLGYKRTATVSENINAKYPNHVFIKAFCEKYGFNDEFIIFGVGQIEKSSEEFKKNTESGYNPFISKEENEQLKVSQSTNKEVIPVGKQAYSRLTPEEYGKAFAGWSGVPMYNVPISASFVQHYHDDPVYSPQYYLFDPRFRDCNFGAIISGDSMHSEIRHGDFVALKEIKNKDIIMYGDIYYIVTDEQETCKYVNADPNDPERVMLVPRNDKISPVSIRREDIMKLYKVRGIIRGY